MFALTTSTSTDVLLALCVVLVGVRGCGWMAARIGQPRVVGEIVAGLLLGPSVAGRLAPALREDVFPSEVIPVLRGIGQLGVVLFMFLVGLSLQLDELRGIGHRAVAISHASIIVPFGLGASLGLWLHPRFAPDVEPAAFVLFMGAAMAITALPVLARILQESGMLESRIGVLTIACAVVDDVTAWLILTVVLAVSGANDAVDVVSTLLLSAVLVGVVLGIARPLVARLRDVSLAAAVTAALAVAWIAELIGIHAVFGAFLAGICFSHAPTAAKENIRQSLESATLAIVLPAFFVTVGLAARVDLLGSAYLWGVSLLVLVAAVIGKWGASTVVARLFGERWRDASVIGVLMNTRGLTELVILTIGVESGVLPEVVYTIMVLMALVTTAMTQPIVRRLYRNEKPAEGVTRSA